MEIILWIWMGLNLAAVLYRPIAMWPMTVLGELPRPFGFIFGSIISGIVFLPSLIINAAISMIRN